MCPGQDLNLHPHNGDQSLKLACLPIPPPGLTATVLLKQTRGEPYTAILHLGKISWGWRESNPHGLSPIVPKTIASDQFRHIPNWLC